MKKIKVVEIDVNKCNGCRACEVICSAFHAMPRYGSSNPEKARVRLLSDPVKDIYLPVFAGEYTKSECNGRDVYIIDGKKYDECSLCRSSCPSRTLFKDPDSGLPLKCDMCEQLPEGQEPSCVQWCLSDALTYREREVEEETLEKRNEMEIGLETLVKQHGLKKVTDTLRRLAEDRTAETSEPK